MDKVWAITMVANESDIISYTLSHLEQQGFDGLVIADNLSGDNTGRFLRAYDAKYKGPMQVILLKDNEPAYYQSQKMTMLAALAGAKGAQWIVPFDADELLYSYDQPKEKIADIIRNSPSPVIGVPMFNHKPTTLDDKNEPNPFKRLKHRLREPNPIDKVIFRWEDGLVIGQGNHNVLKDGVIVPGANIGIAIRHFPHRTFGQFVKMVQTAKTAYGNAPKIPKEYGEHKRLLIDLLFDGGIPALAAFYYQNIFRMGSSADLVYDPAPYRGEL